MTRMLSTTAFAVPLTVCATGIAQRFGGVLWRCPGGRAHPVSARRTCTMNARKAEPDSMTLDRVKEDLAAEVSACLAAISATDSSDTLEKIRVEYMGKKGKVTAFMKKVGTLPPEDRPNLGAVVNVAKQEINEKLARRKEELEDAELARECDDDFIDVTVPGLRRRPHIGHIHPLNATMDKAVDIFVNLGYDLIDEMSEYNREIETDFYCFEALNCPKDHPAREMQDTFYMKEDKSLLLRTQTSAVQIRYMQENKPPLAIIAPGRVYRRDNVDSTHTPIFHQIEILNIRPFGELTVGSLRATLIHFLKEMFGSDIETRFRASYFPFTTPSMEVDVYFGGRWLEVLGCGMVDPNVLSSVGIDPEKYSGFAAGFGVERFAMVINNIPDIREFYKSDTRFLEQFSID